MNRKHLIVTAEWLVGGALYLALSAAVARIFVLLMLHWTHGDSVSGYTALEMIVLRRPIFVICVWCGAFYALALAKPKCFGGTPRILKHMGWSYLLCVLGCVLPIRIVLLPLPDFPSIHAVSAYIVVGLIVSGLCFAAAIAAWVRIAFGKCRALEQTTAEG